MGGWAARKALRVVENVEFVLAIELMCVCQVENIVSYSFETKFFVLLLILLSSGIGFSSSSDEHKTD